MVKSNFGGRGPGPHVYAGCFQELACFPDFDWAVKNFKECSGMLAVVKVDKSHSVWIIKFLPQCGVFSPNPLRVLTIVSRGKFIPGICGRSATRTFFEIPPRDYPDDRVNSRFMEIPETTWVVGRSPLHTFPFLWWRDFFWGQNVPWLPK